MNEFIQGRKVWISTLVSMLSNVSQTKIGSIILIFRHCSFNVLQFNFIGTSLRMYLKYNTLLININNFWWKKCMFVGSSYAVSRIWRANSYFSCQWTLCMLLSGSNLSEFNAFYLFFGPLNCYCSGKKFVHCTRIRPLVN